MGVRGLTDHAVPGSGLHIVVLKASRLDSVDEGTPHPKLPHDLVQRRLAHEEFLGSVCW